MRKLLIVSIAAAFLTLPETASAQSPPPTQKQQSLQSQMKSNLEQVEFTNVRMMASSFLVQSKDKEGNPVLMVINPDSVTSATEISGGQRSAAAREIAATGAATPNENLTFTSAQRHDLWQGLSKQMKEGIPAGFAAKVGETVPSSIKLQSLPADLIMSSQIPAVESYTYAMTQSDPLIVDPTSKKIVHIITQ